MADGSYIKAVSIEQALELAGTYSGDYIYSGGGTDIQINKKQELLHKSLTIDLSEVSKLRNIYIADNTLLIGAMVTLDELAASKIVRDWCPLIVKAAKSIATPVIRLTATVAGNLLVANRCTFFNQSASWRQSAGSCLRETGDTCLATGGRSKCYSRNVSDLAPAFLALNAGVIIQDRERVREIALAEIYNRDGIQYHANLDNDAIIIAIRITLQPRRWWYRKLRRRQSIDFTSLTVAGALDENGRVSVCLNGISMAPVIFDADSGSLMLDKMISSVRRSCRTVDNDLMPMGYRREMVSVFLEDLYNSILRD